MANNQPTGQSRDYRSQSYKTKAKERFSKSPTKDQKININPDRITSGGGQVAIRKAKEGEANYTLSSSGTGSSQITTNESVSQQTSPISQSQPMSVRQDVFSFRNFNQQQNQNLPMSVDYQQKAYLEQRKSERERRLTGQSVDPQQVAFLEERKIQQEAIRSYKPSRTISSEETMILEPKISSPISRSTKTYAGEFRAGRKEEFPLSKNFLERAEYGVRARIADIQIKQNRGNSEYSFLAIPAVPVGFVAGGIEGGTQFIKAPFELYKSAPKGKDLLNPQKTGGFIFETSKSGAEGGAEFLGTFVSDVQSGNVYGVSKGSGNIATQGAIGSFIEPKFFKFSKQLTTGSDIKWKMAMITEKEALATGTAGTAKLFTIEGQKGVFVPPEYNLAKSFKSLAPETRNVILNNPEILKLMTKEQIANIYLGTEKTPELQTQLKISQTNFEYNPLKSDLSLQSLSDLGFSNIAKELAISSKNPIPQVNRLTSKSSLKETQVVFNVNKFSSIKPESLSKDVLIGDPFIRSQRLAKEVYAREPYVFEKPLFEEKNTFLVPPEYTEALGSVGKMERLNQKIPEGMTAEECTPSFYLEASKGLALKDEFMKTGTPKPPELQAKLNIDIPSPSKDFSPENIISTNLKKPSKQTELIAFNKNTIEIKNPKISNILNKIDSLQDIDLFKNKKGSARLQNPITEQLLDQNERIFTGLQEKYTAFRTRMSTQENIQSLTSYPEGVNFVKSPVNNIEIFRNTGGSRGVFLPINILKENTGLKTNLGLNISQMSRLSLSNKLISSSMQANIIRSQNIQGQNIDISSKIQTDSQIVPKITIQNVPSLVTMTDLKTIPVTDLVTTNSTTNITRFKTPSKVTRVNPFNSFSSDKKKIKKNYKKKNLKRRKISTSKDLYILPDLSSVSITEAITGREATAPKATRNIKRLARFAFSGGSGYVPTEEIRKGKFRL